MSTVLSNYQQSVTFNAKGTYTATLSFYITDFEIFGGAKRDGITLDLKQTFEVLDRYDDVYITYVTDSEHPFDDGTTERTVIYSLANDITTLSKKVFDTNFDILYGWVIKPNISASTAYGSGTVMEATKYIGNFNSQHITLYAVWDSGITITAQADGNDGVTQFIYMGTSGKYQVKLSDFDNMITTPSGYKHVGWTGGFLGDEIVAKETYSISDQDIEWNNPDYFVITAVFKKILTVGYSIDGTYSNDWQRGETVVEGGTVANPNLHSNVSCKIDGYEFKGWYVKGDETKTIVDLSTYEITENTTFVALFGAIEEEST